MTSDDLINALARSFPRELCAEMVHEYQQMRIDFAVGTVGRSSPGKIVEGFAQTLEYLATGKYSSHCAVDSVLRGLESNTLLDEGLRLCAARVALAMYTLRNKRGIVHKSGLAPNSPDLGFLLSASQWLLAELVRHAKGISMQESDQFVRMLQAPIGTLVEDTGSRRIVLADCRSRDEILLLLQSYYPERISLRRILECLDGIPEKTVRNVLQTLWRQKVVDREGEMEYRLTLNGLGEAANSVVDPISWTKKEAFLR